MYGFGILEHNMGRLVVNEIQKLFCKKTSWLIVVLFFLLNLGLVWYEAVSPMTDTGDFTRKDVVTYYAEHKGQTATEILKNLNGKIECVDQIPEWNGGTEEELDQWMQAWVNAENTESENAELYQYLKQQVQELVYYENYLDNIQNQRERLSTSNLFSGETTYSKRNIEKIAERYKNLSVEALDVMDSYDVELVTESKCTTILLVLFAVYVTLMVFLCEWENGTMALLAPMKYGKTHFFRAKLLATALILFSFTMLLYLENYVTGCLMFGIGDLSRPAQTLDGYIGFPWNLSVGSYLLLFLLEIYIGIMAISALVAVIGIWLKSSVMTCVMMAVIFFAEGLSWHEIELRSAFSILHSINCVAILDVTAHFKTFQTMNLFGYPIYTGTLSLLTAVILYVICSIFAVHLWNRADMKHTMSILYHFGLYRKKHRTISQKFLLWHELYKLMFVHKGVYILLCLGIVQIFCYADFSVLNTETDHYYDYYAEQLEGEVYWRKELFLNSERKYFEQQESTIEKYEKLAEKQKVSLSYVSYLRTQAENERGKKQVSN